MTIKTWIKPQTKSYRSPFLIQCLIKISLCLFTLVLKATEDTEFSNSICVQYFVLLSTLFILCLIPRVSNIIFFTKLHLDRPKCYSIYPCIIQTLPLLFAYESEKKQEGQIYLDITDQGQQDAWDRRVARLLLHTLRGNVSASQISAISDFYYECILWNSGCPSFVQF